MLGPLPLGIRHQEQRQGCARAMRYGAPDYKTVKQILNHGIDRQQLDLIDAIELETPYRGEGRFSRSAASLMNPAGLNS